jgi:hypothetical protein
VEEFFKQILAQIVTYLVFVIIMLFTFACLMTGEFPPRKESVKAQYQVLLEIKNNAVPLLKMSAERLRASQSAAPHTASLGTGGNAFNVDELKALMKQGTNSQDLGEVRQEQERLKKQLDTIIQQNNEIIKLINKK